MIDDIQVQNDLAPAKNESLFYRLFTDIGLTLHEKSITGGDNHRYPPETNLYKSCRGVGHATAIPCFFDATLTTWVLKE